MTGGAAGTGVRAQSGTADPTVPTVGVATEVLRLCRERRWTLATAESLTGGLVAAALVDVPGASSSVRGGVVAYATDAKASVLGVDAVLLAERGAVDPDVALRMASGARAVLGADVGIATTGVAGPEPQDGKRPGHVYVAVSTPEVTRVRHLALPGGRAEVRAGSVRAALDLARAALAGEVVP